NDAKIFDVKVLPADTSEELKLLYNRLKTDPDRVENIAKDMECTKAMAGLIKLSIMGYAKQVSPGYFCRN
ncbi:MAG: hypothetical protein K6F84_03415, partial [Lachnospiraceae bacterium]|nr:hypothetical protein [Lachnospiraceae bacterium]